MKWYDTIIHLNMNVFYYFKHRDKYLFLSVQLVDIFNCTNLKVVYRITLIVLVIGKAQFRRAMLSCDSSCYILFKMRYVSLMIFQILTFDGKMLDLAFSIFSLFLTISMPHFIKILIVCLN